MQKLKMIWTKLNGLNLDEVKNDKGNILLVIVIVVVLGLSGYLLGREIFYSSREPVNQVREQITEAIGNQSEVTRKISDSIDKNQELRGTLEETRGITNTLTGEVRGIREEVEGIGNDFVKADKLISECKSILREIRESGGEEKK